MDDAKIVGLALQTCDQADKLVEATRMLLIQPGSRLSDDDALTAPHHMSNAVSSALWGSVDHLQTLATILRSGAVHAQDGVRPIGPYSLCRGAVENACMALWLLSSDDQATRIRRLLHLTMDDVRDSHAVAMLTGRVVRPVDVRLGDLVAIGQAAGLSSSELLGKTASWGTIVKAADTLIEGDGAEMAWRICSGFAHGRGWPRLAVLERGAIVAGPNESSMLSVTASYPAIGLAVTVAYQVLRQACRRYDSTRRKWTTWERGSL